jgi:hypothetical protein
MYYGSGKNYGCTIGHTDLKLHNSFTAYSNFFHLGILLVRLAFLFN